jgi:anti-sigma-K factor RskA
MNYRNHELLEQLAAEYALGTLRGPARQRFERLLPEHPDALAAVRRWEDRFVELASNIAPVQPPATVWSQIQNRLRHGKARSGVLAGWWGSPRFALAAVVAILALGIALRLSVDTEPTRVIAKISTEQQSEWWRIEASESSEQLIVIASGAITADAAHAYELWALPDSGAAPVSLGLMPQTGTRELSLNQAQRAALRQAGKLAISLEPRGGSPTGAPTGQVLFVTGVIKVG